MLERRKSASAMMGVDDEPRGATVSQGEATRAGVIGLGDIGAGVAASCIAAGLPTTVCDLRPDVLDSFADKATTTTSAAELARQSDVIVVAVVNDAQVEAVLTGEGGAFEGIQPDTVIVVVSTISPPTIVAMAETASEVGASLIDCGVSGGPAAAKSGELIAMVGGDSASIEAARDVLDAMSSLVVTMGGLGTGLIAKLARNVVQYGGWLAAYEGAQIAEAAGVELAKLATVIRASDAKIGGAATLLLRPTVAQFGPDDDAGFIAAMAAGAALARKDLLAALATAQDLGLELPGVEVASSSIEHVFGVAEVEG